MEFVGKIIAVLPLKSGIAKSTGNEWKAQEYVIESHDTYPKKMCFEVFGGEKIEQFAIKAGEELTVFFDIDANQWNDRWFNRLRAWKVERHTAAAPQAAPPMPESFSSTEAPLPQADPADDLPF